MLPGIGRQINRFRGPIAVVVATSIAMALWAPASAAVSPPFKASTGAIHGMRALPNAHLPLLNPMHPQAIVRDTSTSYSFVSALAKVTTTTGQARAEAIDAGLSSGCGCGTAPAPTADVVLARHNSSFSQVATNDWYFQNLVATDFTRSGGNATVTLKSSQIGAFGSLSGAFTHTASKALRCSSGSETEYTGTFKLTEHFYTKNSLETNSSLGAVYGPSGTGGTISFPNTSTNTSALYVDNGCVPVFPSGKTYCLKGTDWGSPSTTSLPTKDLYGSKETVETSTPSSYAYAGGSRTAQVNGLPTTGGYGGTPVLLDRYDYVSDSAVTNQYYSQGSSTPYPLTLKTSAPSGDTYMRGSATEKSAGSTRFSRGSCYAGTALKTQHERSSTPNYSWTNGSTPLTADSAVGGNITLGNQKGDKYGYIDHNAYS